MKEIRVSNKHLSAPIMMCGQYQSSSSLDCNSTRDRLESTQKPNSMQFNAIQLNQKQTKTQTHTRQPRQHLLTAQTTSYIVSHSSLIKICRCTRSPVLIDDGPFCGAMAYDECTASAGALACLHARVFPVKGERTFKLLLP